MLMVSCDAPSLKLFNFNSTDRQGVKINICFSFRVEILFGVLQGPMIGPVYVLIFFFAIYFSKSLAINRLLGKQSKALDILVKYAAQVPL